MYSNSINTNACKHKPAKWHQTTPSPRTSHGESNCIRHQVLCRAQSGLRKGVFARQASQPLTFFELPALPGTLMSANNNSPILKLKRLVLDADSSHNKTAVTQPASHAGHSLRYVVKPLQGKLRSTASPALLCYTAHEHAHFS